MGYNETSKAYKIYVPGQRHIEVSRDVTSHEEVVFKCSKELPLDTKVEEFETPQGTSSGIRDIQFRYADGGVR